MAPCDAVVGLCDDVVGPCDEVVGPCDVLAPEPCEALAPPPAGLAAGVDDFAGAAGLEGAAGFDAARSAGKPNNSNATDAARHLPDNRLQIPRIFIENLLVTRTGSWTS